MKKLLLSLCLASAGAINAQTILFEDSFEAYDDFLITDVGAWTLTDIDLLPTYGFEANVATFPDDFVAKSFQVFNSTTTEPPLVSSTSSDWTARTGDKMMACFAGVPGGGIDANNDWLISPQITLAASGNTVSFWAKSCDDTYGAEQFGVYVSIGGTDVADFLDLVSDAPNVTTDPTLTWTEYTYNLDAFAGQPVYIGINCVSADQFGFAVDDFKVSTTLLGVEDSFTQSFAVYPNPATEVLNISTKDNALLNEVQLTDLNGRVVKTLKVNAANQTQINVSDLSSGIYFLKATSDAASATKKIVIN